MGALGLQNKLRLAHLKLPLLPQREREPSLRSGEGDGELPAFAVIAMRGHLGGILTGAEAPPG